MTVQELITLGLSISRDSESKVFFLKLRGDYNRYLLETGRDDDLLIETEKTYDEALEISKGDLAETNLTRLALELNYAAFLTEHLDNKEKANSFLYEVLDKAVERMDRLQEIPSKESQAVMEIIKEKLE